MVYVGLDIGSVSVKAVIFDENLQKIEGTYLRHNGHVVDTALEVLKNIKTKYSKCSLSITGSGSKLISQFLNIKPVNELVAQAYSVKKLYPQVKTIIELGGEDSKLIILKEGEIKDFALNSVCAAGTGSFLEQQAERLRLSIDDFSKMAIYSKRPSKIAGRCSVFAKSDMIHLQQIATPVEDIVAGLCFAVARNYKGTIAKGLDLMTPISFQGGVAANAGMVRAFKEILQIDDLIVPEDFALMGAIGSLLKDYDDRVVFEFNDKLLLLIEKEFKSIKTTKGYSPLICEGDSFFQRHLNGNFSINTKYLERINEESYLGIDIGSISTNLAVIDKKGNLIAKRYLMTAGRPIEAVNQGLREIFEEIGEKICICGVGTTGSGRYMIADYVGADIVKNEITAQATAATFIDPKVDTIFEIGGQDSKYISLKDGVIIDFEMNKACAAGTGSFLEEQAEKLDINIKEDFANYAFCSQSPCMLGERCTVFMENSLISNLQKGIPKKDLLAGLAYSIVQNYINRVVTGKRIGDKIFFQGGVAFNKSVVAAFEKYLDKEIIVPPNHDVTGAIGMAIIARDFMKESQQKTLFKGFDISKKEYNIDSFECKGCPNVCEINRVKVKDEKDYLYYGGRCEKYDLRKSIKPDIKNIFVEREERLWQSHNEYSESKRSKKGIKIGLPYIFYIQDYLPYWSTFLWELGFEVVVSPKTNKKIVTLGIENVLSEACFPVKVAHGHVKWLIDEGIDAIFSPSFVNLAQKEGDYERSVACPYTQTIPYITRLAIAGIKSLNPVIDYRRGMPFIEQELFKVLKPYDVTKSEVSKAIAIAIDRQRVFDNWIRQKGKEVFEEIKMGKDVITIVGRSYNAFDAGVNLDIPKKLSQMNVFTIPMDMLPLENISIIEDYPNMYWRSGQRFLKASRIIRDLPNLNMIYIGNFSCGPDSFILKYLSKEMGSKAFLQIEIDEHSADAGAITRCEAYLDSIEQQKTLKKPLINNNFKSASLHKKATVSKKTTLYIPNMTDHAIAIKSAFVSSGIDAEVLPESDKESIEIGKRYVSGKECYPFIVTTGDMLKKVFSSGFKPDKSAFFMPSGIGPCRFGQYNHAQKLILEGLGYDDIPVFAPSQDEGLYKELGIVGSDFSKCAWKGIVANELLLKCLHETRPYESIEGEADRLYNHYHQKIYETLITPKSDMSALLRQIKEEFLSIQKRQEKKPLIGIIGEIYVRSHKFSNENLVRKLESLDAEIWLAPIEEWILYINHISFKRALIKKDISAIMSIFFTRHVQKRIHHKYSHIFEGVLKTLREPEIDETIRLASPYIHDSFEGETILSIGKAVDLIEKGASGIVNAMPFGCMPGTIVTATLKHISRTFGVPCISIPYDGTESQVTQLQLEAFMESAKSHFKNCHK
ncbi:MAG TPA: CoA protein activase [Nitrospirae bacterium]|nr:CoA protein activase [Nitrospirota bacterium]